MDWASYIQRQLYGGQAPGNPPQLRNPLIVAALQRFLMENTYAIEMARQGAAMAQEYAMAQAQQNQVAMSAGLGMGAAPEGGLMNSNELVTNAQLAGNAMIAEAAGQPGWTEETTPEGWGPLRQAVGGM